MTIYQAEEDTECTDFLVSIMKSVKVEKSGKGEVYEVIALGKCFSGNEASVKQIQKKGNAISLPIDLYLALSNSVPNLNLNLSTIYCYNFHPLEMKIQLFTSC